ncbi:Detected protein of unknown function [Hibiscus syriacus]|uniref:ZCF37 n=1 Tax=Hibiscus syriacus TaxID=106335 RepID=A0A6A2XD23_HIBSY|nr:Detected protein of unknown function [Hibiscus syriacus]
MFYPFLCGAVHHQEEEDGDEIWSTSPNSKKKGEKFTQKSGSQSLVRFVYNNSNDCVPVVINLRDKNEDKTKPGNTKERYVPEAINKLQTPSEPDTEVIKMKVEKKKSFSWSAVEFQNLRKPSYFIPGIIILILLLLMLFGRSAAVLCTCVGWYVVPTINGEGSNLRTSMKKKD